MLRKEGFAQSLKSPNLGRILTISKTMMTEFEKFNCISKIIYQFSAFKLS